MQVLASIGWRSRYELIREMRVPCARCIDAMLEHPILINRPIAVTPRGTKLCRPPLLARKPTWLAPFSGDPAL
jgi:ArsC family